MFEVIFEVQPRTSKWDAYLTIAKSLKPQLEKLDGFQGNFRYRSLARKGWLVSVSDWEDEVALVKWREEIRHHQAQVKGREHIFKNYHLRIGEVFQDSKEHNIIDTSSGRRAGTGPVSSDTTKVGAKAVTLMNMCLTGSPTKFGVGEIENAIKPRLYPGLVSWDIFEDILTPGNVMLLCSWETLEAAEALSLTLESLRCERTRHVQVVRDYGMFDRREAPQFYPEVTTNEAL